MNKQTQKALAYTQNALSFIFLDITLLENLRTVYLFGSASRGELEEESDIDLFFDYKKSDEKKIEAAIKAALQRFYISQDYKKWIQLKFTYPFSIHAGNFQEWHLKTSILADGIVVYSKMVGEPFMERKVLITYQLPKQKKKYLSFIRKLFGRNEKGYNDNGIIGKVGAKRLTSTVLLVPKEESHIIFTFLQKEKTEYSFMEVALF